MIIDKIFVCLKCKACVQPIEADEEVLNVACPKGCGQVILSVNSNPRTARPCLHRYFMEQNSIDGPLEKDLNRTVWTSHESLYDALAYLTHNGDLFRIKE